MSTQINSFYQPQMQNAEFVNFHAETVVLMDEHHIEALFADYCEAYRASVEPGSTHKNEIQKKLRVINSGGSRSLITETRHRHHVKKHVVINISTYFMSIT